MKGPRGLVRRTALLSALAVCVLCSCARGPKSASLALALTPGMERTMRFVTEQTIGRQEGSSAAPDSSSISLTYRFRVASVDAARTARLECAVLDARITPDTPTAEGYLKGFTGQKLMAVIDKDGHILSLKSDAPVPGLAGPALPGSAAPRTPAQGDLRGFFGGLNGRRVTVGDTWTSDLAHTGALGLQGKLTWTLASVAGSTARLQYSGTLEQKEVPLPRLPPGKRAIMHGDISGYILLELDTGWPLQGRSVMRAEVSMRDAGAPERAAVDLVTLSITSRFEPVR